MGITADVFGESMNEYNNGFGITFRGIVRSSVELSGLWSWKPGFCVHCFEKGLESRMETRGRI